MVWNFVLFLSLALAISSLTSCGGTSDSSVNNATANTAVNSSEGVADKTNAAVPEKTPSEYPALKSDIAQADFKTMDGSTFKIADKKGKVILVNMWATWCGPCLSEMPAFVKMQGTYGPQGFEILGLDTDDESDTLMADINKVIKEKNINYPIVFSEASTQVAFLKISNFDGIPQSFLIDADGNLHGVFKGANPENVAKIEQIVSGLVGQNKASE